jgi:transcriptional regulator with XRE-family HTH domain
VTRLSRVKMSIGNRLKEVRAYLNIKQKDFADVLETKRSIYCKYETNVCYPAIDIMINLNRIYNINLNWLIAGKGNMLQGKE